MRKKFFLAWAFLLAVASAGWAGEIPPGGWAEEFARLKKASPAELAQESTDRLVAAWIENQTRGALNDLRIVRAELERRGTFTAEEWQLIDERKIRLGMRELVVHASWGQPRRTLTSRGTYGIVKQFVYGGLAKSQYVFIENGVVSSIHSSE